MSRNHRIVEAGIEALREEQASSDLRPRILGALQRKQGARMSHRILKLSIATVVAAGLIAGIALYPRESLASSPAKVARAFREVMNYHIKSYTIEKGKRTLASETWVTGEKRRTTFYDASGKPIEGLPTWVEDETHIIQDLRKLPENEIVDPDVFAKIISAKEAVTATVTDVQVVNPDGTVQKLDVGNNRVSIEGMKGSDIMVIGAGGSADAAYLRELLTREGIWRVRHGNKVDTYTLAATGDIELEVDPVTFLPQKLRMVLTDTGTVVEDVFYYDLKP